MRWSEFAAHQYRLAVVAEDQLIKPGVVLIGTTRRDGSARISGVEPLLMDGDLWLSMMPASTKARDLHRDPWILLHSIVTNPAPQAEIMMHGAVRIETELLGSCVTPLPPRLTLAGGLCPANLHCWPWISPRSLTSGMTPGAMPSTWLVGQPERSTCALRSRLPALALLSRSGDCSPTTIQPECSWLCREQHEARPRSGQPPKKAAAPGVWL